MVPPLKAKFPIYSFIQLALIDYPPDAKGSAGHQDMFMKKSEKVYLMNQKAFELGEKYVKENM